MTNLAKSCPVCGKKVTQWEATTTYCSHRCYIAARRAREWVTFTCQECGTEVRGTKFWASRRKFCSRECHRKHNVGKQHPLWSSVMHKCIICGDMFKPKEDKVRRKFCSRACWIKHIQGDGHPRRRVAGVKYMSKSKHGSHVTWVVKTTDGKWRAEHRVIMEAVLGRPLKRSEDVHHKNGNSLDNRVENLQVFANRSEHMRLHHEAELIGLSVLAGAWMPTVEGMAC